MLVNFIWNEFWFLSGCFHSCWFCCYGETPNSFGNVAFNCLVSTAGQTPSQNGRAAKPSYIYICNKLLQASNWASELWRFIIEWVEKYAVCLLYINNNNKKKIPGLSNNTVFAGYWYTTDYYIVHLAIYSKNWKSRNRLSKKWLIEFIKSHDARQMNHFFNT